MIASYAMARDDETPSEDPDRAAILARRQHFIAIALSSLATTTACRGPGERDTPSGEHPRKGDADASSAAEGSGKASVDPPPSAPSPDPGETSGSETGESETGDAPKAVPRPCLSEARRPTKRAPPQACLLVY